MKGGPLAFWLAVGGTSIMSMFFLNLAADRIHSQGLEEFRDYVTRRNG